MAKHADTIWDTGPIDGMVVAETWSGNIYRYEEKFHMWNRIDRAMPKVKTHHMEYDSYGNTPVGTVVVFWYFLDDSRVMRRKADGFWEHVV